MIKCCIFDLDGTLFDTMETITHYVNIALDSIGRPGISLDMCKSFVGNGAINLMNRALNAVGEDDDEKRKKATNTFIRSYDNDPYYLTKPYPGIVELIDRLKQKGVKLAVLSNKQNLSTRSIVEYFFPNTFDVVYGARLGIPLKPDPTAGRMILEQLGVEPECAAWIGDTSIDVTTGKNIGVALTIGVPWGFRDRDELVLAGADIIPTSAEEVYSEVMNFD